MTFASYSTISASPDKIPEGGGITASFDIGFTDGIPPSVDIFYSIDSTVTVFTESNSTKLKRTRNITKKDHNTFDDNPLKFSKAGDDQFTLTVTCKTSDDSLDMNPALAVTVFKASTALSLISHGSLMKAIDQKIKTGVQQGLNDHLMKFHSKSTPAGPGKSSAPQKKEANKIAGKKAAPKKAAAKKKNSKKH